MNAGCFYHEIKDYFISALYIDSFGKIKEIKNNEMMFKYRESVFKYIKGIIIEVKFIIRNDVKTVLDGKRISDELKYHNMGSIFRNFDNKYAYEVIDELGYRGYEHNDVYVWDKHPNYIVNKKNASGEDIYNLILKIESDAFNKLGLKLQKEIIILE